MERRTRSARAAWPLAALASCASCATYEPAPIEPARVLAALEAVAWAPAEAVGDAPAAGPRELAAFAVTTHPELAALRAEVGLRRALLVEAGLLPDPELSWDAMDLLASEIVEGTSSDVDALAGFGLLFPLLRPGEGDARVGAAEARAEEARRRVAEAEWSLTRRVHVACEELRAAEELAARTRALTELAASTHSYFERARGAGAATAIQAHLALGELQVMRLDAARADARVVEARQALNALLGLPPDTELALRDGADPSRHPALAATPAELTARAVETRPDLAALLARHRTAEEELRLAIATQYPSVSLGTGIALTLPVLSDFGRPRIATALARREAVRREFTAAVHAARQEIAAAHARWRLAQREVELVEEQLLPNAEQSLELSRAAFRAGEVTLLETLALQRALVEARTRHTETRAERAKSAWTLLAASRRLLDPTETDEGEENEENEDPRP